MPSAKKKASKRFDPKQLFTVITVDRETIADQLNAALGVSDKEIPEFEPDDPRLTDKVCQDIADSLYDAYCNAADNEMDEAEHELYIDTLDRFE